jgi:hypothetical protein
MKELEDFNWFPQFLRNYQTDYIGFVVSKFKIYQVFIDYLNKHNLKSNSMFDLCSGSGEPAITIFKNSNKFQELKLSDKFPPAFQSKNNILYIDESTDATEHAFIPGETYTMFNAFHHFSDTDKLNIVRKCRSANSNLLIVEILEPTLFFALKVLVLTTIGVLLFNPFVKPFSCKRLLFTYVLPINIITITIDGIISVIKSRNKNSYIKLFLSMEDVKIFRLKKGISSLLVIELIQK